MRLAAVCELAHNNPHSRYSRARCHGSCCINSFRCGCIFFPNCIPYSSHVCHNSTKWVIALSCSENSALKYGWVCSLKIWVVMWGMLNTFGDILLFVRFSGSRRVISFCSTAPLPLSFHTLMQRYCFWPSFKNKAGEWRAQSETRGEIRWNGSCWINTTEKHEKINVFLEKKKTINSHMIVFTPCAKNMSRCTLIGILWFTQLYSGHKAC